MVSTEYPPMQGGVGRICKNLVNSLRKEGLELLVICNERGEGDFSGLSPYNTNNADVLLRISKDSNLISYMFNTNKDYTACI